MYEKPIDPKLTKLAQGATLALTNAKALFSEGQALFSCKAYARALFLHQISLEECAKVEMLGCWATLEMMGDPVDLRNMRSLFTSHKVKNFTNAYMLPASEAELEARKKDDWRAAFEVFREQQASFHHEANDRKNAALYVDFVDDMFVSPSDRITEEMVRDTLDRNQKFIELMRPKVEMLNSWATGDSGQLRKTLHAFRTRMEELREKHPNQPGEALNIVLEEMIKEARGDQQD